MLDAETLTDFASGNTFGSSLNEQAQSIKPRFLA
ncbi:hypothetical protein ABENE_17805 [Asticcacaulis benevestitus DSM 16100 = ATCC BAA-896]|uniref:Uncharacterized protein n=1 Tax=Asticcacaulis benevestitus DSM 16100 = ATCC BAA-896 TaxID=1121022 RepID=V4PMU8_9CAUL|nr:hypothetical protein ABENE_17805 [Asticcacaulis benevestitus DSM 16100 = ATCC BAA-896]